MNDLERRQLLYDLRRALQEAYAIAARIETSGHDRDVSRIQEHIGRALEIGGADPEAMVYNPDTLKAATIGAIDSLDQRVATLEVHVEGKLDRITELEAHVGQLERLVESLNTQTVIEIQKQLSALQRMVGGHDLYIKTLDGRREELERRLQDETQASLEWGRRIEKLERFERSASEDIRLLQLYNNH